jgi:hypothetical protein
MQTAPTHMSEEQAVNLVRNALLVAGAEMGTDGDHWPVIKSTVYSVVKDYEDLKIERNVSEELKKYYGGIIENVQKNLHLCPLHQQDEVRKILQEMKDIYQARFEEPVDQTMFVVCDADKPIHIQRMQEIIKTLESENV